MDMGLPSTEHAALQALIAASAPEPVPAAQAIAALQPLAGLAPEALGRLAYHALTGIEPGEGDPEPPGAVAPGFPPFAAEVLMRAICGPDHRRPTAQALLVVLDTVPATSWPTAAQPFVAVAEPLPVAEPVVEVEPEPVPVPAPAAEPADEQPVLVPEEITVARLADREHTAPREPAGSTREMHDEFRALLTPSRTIPRFDPLTDPWVPEPAPVPTVDAEPAAAGAAPEAETPAPAAPPEPEPVTEPEPVAVLTLAERLAASVPEETEQHGMHEEFRGFVSAPAEPEATATDDDGADSGTAPEPDAEEDADGTITGRRRRSRVDHTDEGDRQQTLILVAVILAIILLGVVYAASRGSDDSDDAGGSDSPQGASLVIPHPAGDGR